MERRDFFKALGVGAILVVGEYIFSGCLGPKEKYTSKARGAEVINSVNTDTESIDDVAKDSAFRISTDIKKGYDFLNPASEAYKNAPNTGQNPMDFAYAVFKKAHEEAKSIAEKTSWENGKTEYLKLEVLAGMYAAKVLRERGMPLVDKGHLPANYKEAEGIYNELIDVRKELNSKADKYDLNHISVGPAKGFPVATIDLMQNRIAECRKKLK